MLERKQIILKPVLVSYTQTAGSWNLDVSTVANHHHIFLVPENLFNQDFIESIEFHNRAMLEVAQRQYSTPESKSSFLIENKSFEEIKVCMFKEHEKKELLDGEEIKSNFDLFLTNRAVYQDLYVNEDTGVAEFNTHIEIYKVKMLSEPEYKLMVDIHTPTSELDLQPVYALVVKSEEEDMF